MSGNTIHGDEPRTIRTPALEAAFLGALAETCNITEACRTVDVARSAVYQWRQEDAAFAARWKMALDIGAESLEDEAVRRARDGYDKPVFQGGQFVGVVREYSDTLMVFLLKGARPKKYRENVHVRSETISLDKLFERMTPQELEEYSKSGKFPAHLNAGDVSEGP